MLFCKNQLITSVSFELRYLQNFSSNSSKSSTVSPIFILIMKVLIMGALLLHKNYNNCFDSELENNYMLLKQQEKRKLIGVGMK